jgi:hypothetical protein
MLDFRERIKDMAKICKVELTYEQLSSLNHRVNDNISNGMHEFSALDHAYFFIKRNYTKNKEDDKA